MAILRTEHITKSYQGKPIIEDISISLNQGEIICLLGVSGSGKSTLFHIVAGVLEPDKGRVFLEERDITGQAGHISYMQQKDLLLPYKTILDNVALPLILRGERKQDARAKALTYFRQFGLQGTQAKYPTQLSGGMRQRVGIARALVTGPDVLLMDEAFSALDVLTGETLRDDILELWEDSRIPTKGILIVSHNIEEAVMMADRIIIMSGNPGRIRSEIKITLPRPRNVESIEVRRLIDEVYGLMTMRPVLEVVSGAAPSANLGYRLPDTDISLIEGVLDMLADAPFNGRADLPKLSEETELPDEKLFPAFEALGLLGLAHIEKGDLSLTPLGLRYVNAEQAEKQEIFGQQLLLNVPLSAHIRERLEQEPTGALTEKPFLDLLEEYLKADEAQRVLGVAVEWGRYGEVYEYDYHTGRLTLPASDDE